MGLLRRMVFCCVLALMAGCTGLDPHKIPLEDAPHRLHLVYKGWHTSLLVEAEPLLRHSPRLAADFEGQRYIRLGWGDGDYFTGVSKSWRTATKALVASDYSALQALAYDFEPFDQIPAHTRVPLALSEEGMAGLAAFIEASIALDAQGEPVHLPPSKTNDNLFYLASHRYSLVYNCNTWSAQALQRAGLPVASRGRVTAGSVFRQAARISAVQAERGLFESGDAKPLDLSGAGL